MVGHVADQRVVDQRGEHIILVVEETVEGLAGKPGFLAKKADGDLTVGLLRHGLQQRFFQQCLLSGGLFCGTAGVHSVSQPSEFVGIYKIIIRERFAIVKSNKISQADFLKKGTKIVFCALQNDCICIIITTM